MNTIWRTAVLASGLTSLSITALAQEPTPTERAIENAITPNIENTSPEFWIATINVMGEKERVGLIHGMAENQAFCNEITRVYRERYPNNIFFCESAN